MFLKYCLSLSISLSLSLSYMVWYFEYLKKRFNNISYILNVALVNSYSMEITLNKLILKSPENSTIKHYQIDKSNISQNRQPLQ